MFTPVLKPSLGDESKKDSRSTVGGVVDKNGNFSATTYNTGDGAPPGEYTVSLRGESSDAGSTDPAAMMRAVTGGGVNAEPLKVTIPPEGNSSLELKFVTSATPAAAPKQGTPLGAPIPK
jgi:hypothetical protein